MNKGFSIAIDGPVASGKGTIARALAKALNGVFINTGGMYRCLALLCIENNIDFENINAVEKLLPKVNVKFNEEKIFLNGKDVSERLKDEDVTHGSSVVATYENVRKDLVGKQRKMAYELIKEGKIVIAEGRDTGTRVLPDANLKIFLTASIEVRAGRSLERDKKRGIVKDLDTNIKETRMRDERDMGREIDPLPSDPKSLGYWVLDNSKQKEDGTIGSVLYELRKRKLYD